MIKAIIFDVDGVLKNNFITPSGETISKRNIQVYKIVDFLKHNKYKIAILTNVNTESKLKNIKLGFYEPFSTQILSCDYNIFKPDPEIFKIALKPKVKPPKQ